ncbi:5'-methylthioadenosine/adenosylhomocysteine nucleosidase [Oscillospiraceae bacterium OttesenSCG-928-G22]|nr:5'-methylthioadenosine/adenosylhomocysteine nucleosidase [Oscillospiraceae bacterium OttesenSCG-928-G22]
MRTIGLVCAVDRELEPYRQVMKNDATSTKSMLTFHQGTIDGVNVAALYCGVCKVNAAVATQILIDRYAVDVVVMSGTAGAIDETLNIGDSVIATEVCYHDVEKSILTEYHPWMPREFFPSDPTLLALCRAHIAAGDDTKLHYGRIATGETFIDRDGRDAIIGKCHPLCVDMETASVAHVCYVNEIPFIAVRSISDTPENSGEEVFRANCNYASAQSFAIVRQLLSAIGKQWTA